MCLRHNRCSAFRRLPKTICDVLWSIIHYVELDGCFKNSCFTDLSDLSLVLVSFSRRSWTRLQKKAFQEPTQNGCRAWKGKTCARSSRGAKVFVCFCFQSSCSLRASDSAYPDWAGARDLVPAVMTRWQKEEDARSVGGRVSAAYFC